jgi:hypothetical protein
MNRIARLDLLFAAWLMPLIVFGLSDATSASELAAHGVAAILLIIAGEQLGNTRVAGGAAAAQIAGGVLLCATSLGFHRDLLAVVPLTDLMVGSTAATFGVIASCEIVHEQITGRRWLAP